MSKSYLAVHDFQALNVSSNEQNVIPAGSSISLKPMNSGDIILLNSNSGSAITLASPNSGLNYEIIVAALGSHTITCPSNQIYGNVGISVYNTASNLVANASTVISTTSGSVVGDHLKLCSDGVNYYLSGNVAHWNSIVFS
jgi:hypothetical protein